MPGVHDGGATDRGVVQVAGMSVWTACYLGGLGIGSLIRAAYGRGLRERGDPDLWSDPLDTALMALGGLGILVLPLVYAFTPLLSFADYRLPDAAGVAGAFIFATALLIFWRSHADLGENWSPVPTVSAGQNLVTTGVYSRIRHPMYLAHLLWALALPFLLWNGVAGWAMLVAVVPLILRRMPREEAMMIDHFGEEYRAYMARTGRLVPRPEWR